MQRFSPSISAHLQASRNARRAPARSLVVAGRFDRAGIMREAVRTARTIGMPGWTWAERMRVGLTRAWRLAREEMARPAAFPTSGARDALATRPARQREPVVSTALFVRGSRIFSHGW